MNRSLAIAALIMMFFACKLTSEQALPKINRHFKIKKIYQDLDASKSKKDQSLNSLLGLKIDDLISAGNKNLALSLLEKELADKKLPASALNYRLAILTSQGPSKTKWRKHFKELLNTEYLLNTSLIKNLYEKLASSEKKWLYSRLRKSNFFDPVFWGDCPFFELPGRKLRANFLFTILQNQRISSKNRNQIFKELFVDIPEVIAVDELRKVNEFSGFEKKTPANLVIKRMEKLMLFGKNNEARSTFLVSQKRRKEFSKENICELNYQNAKVSRKMREYSLARSEFRKIARECTGYTRLKARFMNLQLSAMMSDSSVLGEFNQFVADNPKHGFSDDVLMFKVSLLFDLNRNKEAQSTLDQLIRQFPNGDMIFRALFQKAIDLANRGLLDQALESLIAAKKVSSPDSQEYAQAEYWLARLKIFGDTRLLNEPRKSEIKNATESLRGLFYRPQSDFYSLLSYILLQKLGQEPSLIADSAKNIDEPDYSLISPSSILIEIEKLIDYGFTKEAEALLEEIRLSNADYQQAMNLGILFDRINKPHLAHRKLLHCNKSASLGLRQNYPMIEKRISYPLIFEKEIDSALSHIDVPQSVILAIIRRESGFLKEARSWAQARGLMQLVFNSATEQAKFFGIKSVKKNELYEPKLNILLGSSLLFRYWKRFGHIALALAAYNAGPGNVSKWSKRNDGLALDYFIDWQIPFKETRAYVKEVLGGALAYAQIYNLKDLPKFNTLLPKKLN